VTSEHYSDVVMDHLRSPRNTGRLEDANAVGLEVNPVCGDTLRLMLRIEDGRVADVRFQAEGCGAALAASSLTTELIASRPLDEVAGLTRQQISAALGGLPPSKAHASALALGALRKALADYRRRSGG
jgi:nitrogen fixation NifU-like protein